MAIHMPRIINDKKILHKIPFSANRDTSTAAEVPKGYLTVYVGAKKRKRFVIPISFLSQPCFQDLLNQAEEELGFDHPMGGLTIPCRGDMFVGLTSRMSGL